jgi:hypothetical protein
LDGTEIFSLPNWNFSHEFLQIHLPHPLPIAASPTTSHTCGSAKMPRLRTKWKSTNSLRTWLILKRKTTTTRTPISMNGFFEFTMLTRRKLQHAGLTAFSGRQPETKFLKSLSCKSYTTLFGKQIRLLSSSARLTVEWTIRHNGPHDYSTFDPLVHVGQISRRDEDVIWARAVPFRTKWLLRLVIGKTFNYDDIMPTLKSSGKTGIFISDLFSSGFGVELAIWFGQLIYYFERMDKRSRLHLNFRPTQTYNSEKELTDILTWAVRLV